MSEEKTTEIDWEKKYKDLVKKQIAYHDEQIKMITDHLKKHNR